MLKNLNTLRFCDLNHGHYIHIVHKNIDFNYHPYYQVEQDRQQTRYGQVQVAA